MSLRPEANWRFRRWWRYRYTGDREWLRTHAYPLLRGTVEFYRHLVKKEADGRYHLSGTNAHEDFWGVGDSIMDLAAIRGTVPLAIRAAEILEVDAELRGRWKELLANLAPYPMGADPRAKALTGGALADDVWAAGYLGEINGQNNPEDVWLTPVFPFEDWTLETRDAATAAIAQNALDLAPRHAAVLGGAGLNTAIRTPIAAARAGLKQAPPPGTLLCRLCSLAERHEPVRGPDCGLRRAPWLADHDAAGVAAAECLPRRASPKSFVSSLPGRRNGMRLFDCSPAAAFS